ncbi:MAG: FAD-dependent oxidoreductase [Lentisphaeria bacterium]|nr:FAD-dependent oxidoreductase [Lentisphaeria bacterium]
MKTKRYDVIVCGAGVAGAAAAVAAARRGAKTALVEKQCLLGGLATSGLIYIFLPLCDGYGHQVTSGLAEEMIRRCTEYGPFDVPAQWGGPAEGRSGVAVHPERFQCGFSPAGFSLTLDKMLEEAGADLWLDTVIIGANKTGDAVSSVTVFNTSGKIRLEAGCFVDATGGAYAVQMAGGRIHRAENRVTPWVMEMADDPSVFHFTGPLHVREAWENAAGGGLESSAGAAVYPDCSTGKSITGFVRRSWQLMRTRYDAFKNTDARRRNYPVHLPAMPQLRKIGCIDALKILRDEDRGKHFDDAVGRVGDWRRPAPVWEVPYGSLVPRDTENILAAGRCIGALDDAWEVCRVIPAAALTGEAAGIAASLCAEMNITPSKLDFTILQRLCSR